MISTIGTTQNRTIIGISLQAFEPAAGVYRNRASQRVAREKRTCRGSCHHRAPPGVGSLRFPIAVFVPRVGRWLPVPCGLPRKRGKHEPRRARMPCCARSKRVGAISRGRPSWWVVAAVPGLARTPQVLALRIFSSGVAVSAPLVPGAALRSALARALARLLRLPESAALGTASVVWRPPRFVVKERPSSYYRAKSAPGTCFEK